MKEIFQIAGQIAGIGGISLIVFLVLSRTVISRTRILNQKQSFAILNKLLWFAGLITILGMCAWLVSLAISSDKAVRLGEIELERERITEGGVSKADAQLIKGELLEIKSILERLEGSKDSDLVPEVQHKISQFIDSHGETGDILSIRDDFERVRDRLRSSPSISTPFVSIYLYDLVIHKQSWAAVDSAQAIDREEPNLVFIDPYGDGEVPGMSIRVDQFESATPIQVEIWSNLDKDGGRIGSITLMPEGGEFWATFKTLPFERIYLYSRGSIDLEGTVVFTYA